MRLAALLFAAVIPLSVALPALAADPTPEIARPLGAPQAIGAVHTLRVIPEACTRLEGAFTGEAAKPYLFQAVPTSANCQPRARFVEAKAAKPATSDGWILNDRIRVPSATCPGQQAVVTVWRHPADTAVPPKLDPQGKSRIYLAEGVAKAKAHALSPIPLYAAAMAVEGKACP
ncbi:hypothetical protein [Cognatiluteimonas profundi]|uniref:hypothetical protein n=1 Tax=Cognatiluteimonas profundi TaxID=2594501 RepID=UPI00131CE162|nr:hypothetical protein [Lysobacter profundi]